MLEKALVFRGKNGVNQRGRQIVVAYGPALFAGTVEKIGDELRLDFRGPEFCAAGNRPDRADVLARKLNCQRVGAGKVRKLGRPNVDGVASYRELAERAVVILRAVSHAGEISREVVGTPGLARGDVLGSGENLRRILEDVAGEARVDHARILDVIPGENGGRSEKAGENGSENRQAEFGSPETFFDADAQARLPRARLPLSRKTLY